MASENFPGASQNLPTGGQQISPERSVGVRHSFGEIEHVGQGDRLVAVDAETARANPAAEGPAL